MNKNKEILNDLPQELNNIINKDEINFLQSELNEQSSRIKEYDKRGDILQRQIFDLSLRIDKITNPHKTKKDDNNKSKTKRVNNLFATINQQGIKGVIRTKRRGKFIGRHIKGKTLDVYKFLLPDTIVNQIRTEFDKDIKFSILVPLYNTNELFLKEMIDSVLNQTYSNWELCLADASDKKHKYVEEICKTYQNDDNRIKYIKLKENKGISENTNQALDMAQGEYIALLDHDDILHPSALYENMKAICEKNADFIYTDEVTFLGDDIFDTTVTHLKPDFAIDNLRANNYICHFTCFKKELSDIVGGFRPEYDGSQDFDIVLRLTEKAKSIVHIPHIMYYWRSHKGSVASEIGAKPYCITSAIKAITAHLDRCGLKGKVRVAPDMDSMYKIDYEIKDNPLISIIIPNKDHIGNLHKCLMSIQKSTYKNYEIIIIENNSENKETFKYYDYISKLDNVKVVTYDGDFNYSKINNTGVKYAKGEYYLLLNNDIEVISKNWIEEMLMYAQRKDVGAVGAKLYFPDDRIQHGGVIIEGRLMNMAKHQHYLFDGKDFGYMGRLKYVQDLTAVTAACLLVKKQDFEAVGGFDEQFKVAYNDVDFCLKLREKGLLNVFTPFAELYHYESVSRGNDMKDKKKMKRAINEEKSLQRKWKTIMEKPDPYYNPNFSPINTFVLDVEEYI